MSRTSVELLRSALFGGLRLGFRLMPLSRATRDRWRQRFFDRFPSVLPSGPRGIATAAPVRRARQHAGGRALGYVERRSEPLPSPLPATLVAFYLPQYHTIPENDEWWGRGFTEWRNVARALPQFEGHAQPRLPGELGFYDLRNPQVMHDQAELAREYGIGAFCFYFYWFGGKTLLEAPLEQWLRDESITLSFCLCWANENWSRRWDGRASDILIGQSHSPEDDIAFIAHVAKYLRDPRYLRVDGKPLVLVYRPGLLPDAAATAERWRTWCRDNGIGEICISYVQSFERPDPRDIGFDAAVEFPPNLSTPPNITASQRLINPDFAGQVLDWRAMAEDYRNRPIPRYRLFPGVNCGWDNEPRQAGAGRTYLHASPRRYRDWLRMTIESRLADRPSSQRLVFINAWNEWAEGAVLEPETRLGHAWLQATRNAVKRVGTGMTPPARPCAVVHAWHIEAFEELLASLAAHSGTWRLVITTSAERQAAVTSLLASRGLQAEVEVVENRGRDILPFLHVANRLLDEGEDIVLKLHTKKSLHRQDGDTWRRELLAGLLPAGQFPRIMQAFSEEPRLGLLAPAGHLQPISYFWGLNEDNVNYLATRLGIGKPRPASDLFASGSMFWVRLEALRPLLDAHLCVNEFEPEAGQLDGTLAHAVERIFGLAVGSAGYRTSTVAQACGLLTQESGEYRYAAKW